MAHHGFVPALPSYGASLGLLGVRRRAVALSRDYTLGALGPTDTFTRTSTATFVGANGVLQTAAIDIPRFDYQAGTCCLLIEPTRTNVLLRSQEHGDGAWAGIGAGGTVTSNTIAAPDGTTTGDTFTAGVGTGACGRYQSFTYTAAAYTLAAFFKQGTHRYVVLDFSNGGLLGAKFDLQSGTVVFANATLTATITAVNGWYLCTVSGMRTAIGSFPEWYLSDSSAANVRSITVAGTETVHVWGFQLELGASNSSYIPTTSTAVTRSADVAGLTIPGGVTTLTYTLDDNTTQEVSVSPGAYTIPTTLNRPRIKNINPT